MRELLRRLYIACMAFRYAMGTPADYAYSEAAPAMDGRPEELMQPVVHQCPNPLPAYAPHDPVTCPGCAYALHMLNAHGLQGALCPDIRCGQWWATTGHAYTFVMARDAGYFNPELSH